MLIFWVSKVELFYLQKWSGDWNRIYCVVTSVCVFRFVYTLLLKRNSEVKKMSNDSESNSFANFWSSSDEDILEDDEDDVEENLNTQTDVTRCVTWRFDRAIQLPFFEGKIAQLCGLVKLTTFIIIIPNFGIVYFRRYIFILYGKMFAS